MIAHLAGLILAVVTLQQPQAAPAAKEIRVLITVKKDGEHFPEVPIAVDSRIRGSQRFGRTDEQGRASIAVEAPITNTNLRIRVGRSPRNPEENIEGFHAGVAEMTRLLCEYTFRGSYVVTPDATGNNAVVEIDVTRAVTASITLEREGQPYAQGFYAVAPDRSTLANERTDSMVKVGGITPGIASTFYIGTDDGGILRVAVPPLQESVTLPPLTVPVLTANASIAITTLVSELVDSGFEPFAPGLTLVSSDGAYTFTVAYRRGEGVARDARGELPMIPAGTYYLAPGMFMGRKAQITLIERVVSGEDLTTTSIPRITAVADQSIEVNFNEAAVEAAILAAPAGPHP